MVHLKSSYIINKKISVHLSVFRRDQMSWDRVILKGIKNNELFSKHCITFFLLYISMY
jgi:hypothetical protein